SAVGVAAGADRGSEWRQERAGGRSGGRSGQGWACGQGWVVVVAPEWVRLPSRPNLHDRCLFGTALAIPNRHRSWPAGVPVVGRHDHDRFTAALRGESVTIMGMRRA